MTTRIAITGVSERDIDLMLLEEFLSSLAFQNWFITTALGSDVLRVKVVRAERSVTDSTGESDLEIDFLNQDSSITRLMIENKVKAGLQPQQAHRYLLRGQNYLDQGQCSVFYTVIVGPARYFGDSESNKGFGHRITYESIYDWFKQNPDIGDRRNYKMALLQSAIDRGTLGYQPETDHPTTDFWYVYWELTYDRAPELEMKEPKDKPSGSGFVHFRPPTLPRGVDIVHKLIFGYVDLHLRGMGKHLTKVKRLLDPFLEDGMKVESAAKSAAVRIQVPKLKPHASISEQLENACVGIDTAERLRIWFLKHKKQLPFGSNANQDIAAAENPDAG